MPVGCAKLLDRKRRAPRPGARAGGHGDQRRAFGDQRRDRAARRDLRRGRIERALHAVPLRRFQEQAVLRRLPLAGRFPRPKRRSAMITGGYATVYIADMDRAVAFYVDVLGLKLGQRFGNYWAAVRAGDKLPIG